MKNVNLFDMLNRMKASVNKIFSDWMFLINRMSKYFRVVISSRKGEKEEERCITDTQEGR